MVRPAVVVQATLRRMAEIEGRYRDSFGAVAQALAASLDADDVGDASPR